MIYRPMRFDTEQLINCHNRKIDLKWWTYNLLTDLLDDVFSTSGTFVRVYFCKSAIINQINEWTGSLVRLMDIRARRGKNHLSRRCIDMGNNRIEEIGGG